jgi:hypothetical protein
MSCRKIFSVPKGTSFFVGTKLGTASFKNNGKKI